MSDKELINDYIHTLKKKGIIRFDKDIAEDLGYSRGAVSEIINLASAKPVTYTFLQKFKEKYGKHLKIKHDRSLEEKVSKIESDIAELKKSIIELRAKIKS